MMRRFVPVLGLAACFTAHAATMAPRPTPQPSLPGFANETALRHFLGTLRAARQEEFDMVSPGSVGAPLPAPPAATAAEASNDLVVTAQRAAPAGITNTQIAGVDEGGIVKLAGNMLVVLRRGRLFTVSLAGGGMRPIAAVAAYPPGTEASGDWYDEMLLAGDRVIVVGYSYDRGGTEVNRFRLGRDGSLRFEDSTQLRSADYYSSRNYASRLIGSTLVYYAPIPIDPSNPAESLPAIRQWQAKGGAWTRVVTPQRVFVPQQLRTPAGLKRIDTAHSVTRCDLAAPRIACSAAAVLGDASRSFFVSNDAVYVWTGAPDWRRPPGPARALLYRLPLDPAARPQAVGVRGAPIDQFSFGPDERRGTLNVLVQAEGDGDAMWRPEAKAGALALVRVPMRAFGTGARELPPGAYQPLPPARGYSLQNRHVDDHLLYGGGDERQVTVVGIGDRRVTQVKLPHAVSRLDRMGVDGVAIGSDERDALGFSTLALDGTPRRTDTFLLPAAREGEARSHAFFFRPDSADGRRGLLGLPVARARMAGTRFLGNAAAIQFLARAGGRLAQAGGLAAAGNDAQRVDDGCVASCVDWYGNARPIFWNGRIFALMGYELVEGREQGGRVTEVTRIDFAPTAPGRTR